MGVERRGVLRPLCDGVGRDVKWLWQGGHAQVDMYTGIGLCGAERGGRGMEK